MVFRKSQLAGVTLITASSAKGLEIRIGVPLTGKTMPASEKQKVGGKMGGPLIWYTSKQMSIASPGTTSDQLVAWNWMITCPSIADKVMRPSALPSAYKDVCLAVPSL